MSKYWHLRRITPTLDLIESQDVVVVVDLCVVSIERFSTCLFSTKYTHGLKSFERVPFSIVDEAVAPNSEPQPVHLIGLQKVRKRSSADLGGSNHFLVLAELNELVILHRNWLKMKGQLLLIFFLKKKSLRHNSGYLHHCPAHKHPRIGYRQYHRLGTTLVGSSSTPTGGYSADGSS